MPIRSVVSAFLALFLAALLAACGGGDSGAAPAAQSEVPHEVARATIDVTQGGEIKVTDPALQGAKITIPPFAAESGSIDVQVGYEDTAPGAFLDPQAVAPVSKTLVVKVTGDGSSNFNLPVLVTIPYDAAAAGGVPPTVLYWDPDSSTYIPASVVAVDDVAGTVTFRTSHFSRFIAVTLKNLRTSLGVDTGFQLGVDSILHQNFGSYEYGGHGAAFAAISSFYYSRPHGTPLYQLSQQGVLEQPVDDELTRSAISITYGLLMSKWRAIASTVFNLPPRLTGLLMIQAMKTTGHPVQLLMQGDTPQDGAHSVVVYAYNATTQEFQIYDSNFPKNVVTLPWNETDGFGTYSRAPSYPPGLFKHFGFTTIDSFGSPAQFARIVNDFANGHLQDLFSTLQVQDETNTTRVLAFNQAVTVQIPFADNQTVQGRFIRPAGSTKPVFLHVFENGVQKGTQGTPIAADGSFTLTFPTKLDNRVEITLVVSESAYDRFSGFSGYGKLTVQPIGKNFFVNFGFETGDLTAWSGQTTFLPQSGNNSVFTPTKLTVVDPGFDPIATDIPTVVFGQHAIQVNDRDNGYHTTFVAQTATVPATGNPQLNFKWAAVLEDPNHPPADQPFVEVSVVNTTKGIDLYRKRFFANDPTFNGWKSYQNGQWKAIDWQSVVLSGLSQYAGDQIELRIVGADCGQGGHGGYAYLDGEE